MKKSPEEHNDEKIEESSDLQPLNIKRNDLPKDEKDKVSSPNQPGPIQEASNPQKISLKNCEIYFENDKLSLLQSLTPTDLFPKSILYPGQSSPKTSSTDLMEIEKPSKISFAHSLTTVHFHNDSIVYDLAIIGNLLVVVGDQYMKVYNIENNELLSYYTIPHDNLYCVTLTEKNNSVIAAIGGQQLIIRIINLVTQLEIRQLIGHKNEIYDLKFSPQNSSLLLSASKDTSIRLWNMESGDQICIFGGPLGHIAEVLAIEWHSSGEYFASSGIDNCVKLWAIIPKISEKIRNTENHLPIKTLIKTSPYFSCNTVHDNYIDCIRFNGNLIITKSVDGLIKEWLPLFNREGDSYYIVNTFSYTTKEKIWYIKFCFDVEKNIIMVGNEAGKVHLFRVQDSEDITEEENSNPVDVIDTKTDTIIRSIAYSNKYNICAYASNKGDVIINHLSINS